MEPAPNKIETQANEWAIRLDAGPLSAEEQVALDEWTAADRRHHGALIRARAAWLDTDRLAALAARMTVPDTGSVRHSVRLLAIAASLAAVAIVAALGSYIYLGRGQTYASEIGEVRSIQLPDGSELTLNTNTLAAVQYQDTQRNIALKQGEALFKVAHDTHRPFIVYANDVEIKAVGTAFTVRIDDARVDVTVTEGTVEVARPGAAIQRLSANHRALIASSESRSEIQPVDTQVIDRQLAWRQGMVSFAGEPLSSAVAEINRYSRVTLYIDDPELAAKPVIGIFHANDAAAFAAAAAATFGATVEHANGEIHLR